MNDTPTDKDDETIADIDGAETPQNTHQDTVDDNVDEDPLQDVIDAMAQHSTSDTEAIWHNIALAAIFANLAIFMASGGAGSPSFSNYIGVLHVAIIAFVCMFRLPCVRYSKKPADWVVSILATWAPLALFSIGIPPENEIAVLFIFNLIGIIMATAVIISMNKSFGVVPAQRQIKTGGLFRLVRHPLYMSYSLCITCIAIQSMNPYNIMVTACVLVAIVFAIKEEETFLSENPNYVLYQAQVRKKLIPFIW